MRDKNTVWKNGWPIAYLSKQISFRLFSGWTGTGEAVTFLLHGVCQQLLHGASHSANAKGPGPRGSTSPVCCPWESGTPERFYLGAWGDSSHIKFYPYCHWRLKDTPLSPGGEGNILPLFPEGLVPISQLLENLDQVSVAAAQQVLCCLPGKEEMWPPVALYASSGSSVIMVFTLFMVKIMQFYSDGKSGWQQGAEQPVALRCPCVCEQWATGSPLGAQDLGSSRESNRGCWHMDNPKCVFSPGKMWKPLWYHNGRGERVKLMKLPHHHVSEEGKQWWRTWGQGSKFQVFTC